MIKHKLLYGEPIRVGDRQIIPQARLTWLTSRRAVFGMQNKAAANGWALIRIQPTGLIEQDRRCTRRIPIYDRTAQLLWGLLMGALAIPLLMELAVWLARPKRRNS